MKNRWWILACLLPLTSCGKKPAAEIPLSESVSPTTGVETTSVADTGPGGYLPAPSLLPDPIAGDAMGTTIHRLKNGMTVYISTDRKKPVIQTFVAVRAGSAEDPKNSTGLAHYLEHMLFKGSSRLGTTNFEKEKTSSRHHCCALRRNALARSRHHCNQSKN